MSGLLPLPTGTATCCRTLARGRASRYDSADPPSGRLIDIVVSLGARRSRLMANVYGGAQLTPGDGMAWVKEI